MRRYCLLNVFTIHIVDGVSLIKSIIYSLTKEERFFFCHMRNLHIFISWPMFNWFACKFEASIENFPFTRFTLGTMKWCKKNFEIKWCKAKTIWTIFKIWSMLIVRSVAHDHSWIIKPPECVLKVTHTKNIVYALKKSRYLMDELINCDNYNCCALIWCEFIGIKRQRESEKKNAGRQKSCTKA